MCGGGVLGRKNNEGEQARRLQIKTEGQKDGKRADCLCGRLRDDRGNGSCGNRINLNAHLG